MIYWQLFISFFQIGLFTIGGGYAALPLIEKEIVEVQKWLTMQEYIDIVTISQITPGPIGINAATFVGTKTAGFLGAVIATVGTVAPSVIIAFILAYVYYKYRHIDTLKGILGGLRPAVVALIASAGVSLFLTAVFESGGITFGNIHFNLTVFLLFLAAFFALKNTKVNSVWIILLTGAAGVLLSFAGLL